MSSQNPPLTQGPSPRQLIATLRAQIARLEGNRRPISEDRVSSGSADFDRWLPGRGFHRGTLVEWLAAGAGHGAETLALGVAREAARAGGAVVVLDGSQAFYPPAAAGAGIELERLIVVRPANEADYVWALDQVLRCTGVAALLARPDRLDGRTFRRLQLAAEEAGGLALLVRPPEARAEPSWADVRFWVEPLPAAAGRARGRRLRIDLLHCRGSASGTSIEVEIDDETHTLHWAPAPGQPEAGSRKWEATAG
jgi:hypothetical protein